MIAWDKKYEMGIAELDYEHKKLFQIAERILERIRTRDNETFMRMFIVQEGLNYLQGYFSRHAKREEEYMRENGYEGYELHKMQHDDFEKIQLEKYRKIVKSGTCSKEDAWDFVCSGIGWLLEHITTADMAIVGKGVYTPRVNTDINTETLEREANLLLTSTLNSQAHAKIVSTNYAGESFGKTICQKIIYEKNGRQITAIAGVERSFLLDFAKTLYGEKTEDEMDLVLATLETFGARFWITLSRQLTGDTEKIDVKDNSFLIRARIPEELKNMKPTTSVLFTSDKGKFFVACDSDQLFLPREKESVY